MRLLSQLFLLWMGIILLFTASPPVFASPYGGSTYGSGKYGDISTLTPSPTVIPTNTPTSSNTSNNNGGESNNSSGNNNSCTSQSPTDAPDLFQINNKNNNVTLYFAPANGQVNKYFISYGLKSGEQQFGVEFSQGQSSGALAYTINALTPNTTYYFRVRGGNGCMPGAWSNEMKVVTLKKGSSATVRNYKSLISRIINTILPKKISYVTQKITVPKKTIPTQASITTGKLCEYIVKAGDSLSRIADGDYKQIVELNKKNYPSLSTSTVLRTGWKLQVGC